ncbi:MAG: alpha/beta hydrolase [Anaerolineae bacterium]|nr:alpha/beta hydrolase [Anaerolineae bacterium]
MEKQSGSSSVSRWVTANGLRLHVQDWSGPGAPRLVLLHGLASSSRMFDLIAPNLAAHFRVIAPDQRGHGLSDKPASGYDFETIARDLDALLDAVFPDPRPVALVGHSWGAYTTLYYAATRPDRLAQAVLLDGGVRSIAGRYPDWETARIGMAPPRYQDRSLEEIRQMIRTDWLGPIFRPELEPLALSIFDSHNPQDVRAHLSYENHMQIVRALWEMNPQEFFPRVQCPTLLVAAVPPGQTVSPDDERMIADALSNIAHAEVCWMPDTVHDSPWHRPRELAAILKDFLIQAGR